jgi:hypothetical protein
MTCKLRVGMVLFIGKGKRRQEIGPRDEFAETDCRSPSKLAARKIKQAWSFVSVGR